MIHIENRAAKPRLATNRLKQIVAVICKGIDREDADVSIVCTDDATIAALNKQWRGKDKPTDVLSFSQIEGEGPISHTLGDVIISMETAQRQSAAYGHTLDQEMQRLLVHGMLHLLGHDHVHGGWQARKMKIEERRLLRLLRAADRRKK